MMKKRVESLTSSKGADQKDKRSVYEFGRMRRIRKSPRILRNKLKKGVPNTLETAIEVDKLEEANAVNKDSRKRRKLIGYEEETSEEENAKTDNKIMSSKNYKKDGTEGRSTDCKIISGKNQNKKGTEGRSTDCKIVSGRDGRSSDCKIISGKNLKEKVSEGRSSDCKIISSLKGRKGKRGSVVKFQLTGSKEKNGKEIKNKMADNEDMVDSDLAERKLSKKRKRKEGVKKRKAKHNEGLDEDEQSSKKESGWFPIKTRSAPVQFFKGIASLKEQQKNAVRRMGFGKLLKFKVDGVPARLGHYVVDRFKPKKMQIRVPSGKIKIDKESIHKLLGIPCKGIKLHEVEEMELKDPEVQEWKDRYPGRFVAPTQIVKNIKNADDEDTFNFRLDFLMLFLAVMVECHQQGRCKLNILHKLKDDMSLKKIDWCDYILQSMKKCKRKWKSHDRSKPFAGPLTILTLLYVESIECKGMELNQTLLPIEYWNKNNLKKREKLEIKGTGFGTGKFRNFVQEKKSAADEGDDDNPPFPLLDKTREIRSSLDGVLKAKGKIEKKITEVYDKEPENEDVLTLIARFDSLFKGGFKKKQKDRVRGRKADDQIRNVLGNLANQENMKDVTDDNNKYTDDDEDAYGCGDDVMDNIEETVAADKDNVMGDVEMRKNVGNTRVEGGSSNRKGDNVVEHETIINQEGAVGTVEKGTTNSKLNKMEEIREGGIEPVAKENTIVDDSPSFSLGLSQIGVKKDVVGRSKAGRCVSKNVGNTRVEGRSSTRKGDKVVEDDRVNKGIESDIRGSIINQEGDGGTVEKGPRIRILNKMGEIREVGTEPVAKGTTIVDDSPSFSLGLSQIGVKKPVVDSGCGESMEMGEKQQIDKPGCGESMEMGNTRIDDIPTFSLGLSQLGEKQQIDKPAKKCENENKIYHSGFIPEYMFEKEKKENTCHKCGSRDHVKETKGNKEEHKGKSCDAEVVRSIAEVIDSTFSVGMTTAEKKSIDVKQKGVVGTAFSVGLTPGEKKTVDEKLKTVEFEGMDDKSNLESFDKHRESCIAKLEKARRNPFREEGTSRKLSYDGVDLASEITNVEKNVWNLIFDNEGVDASNVANKKAKLKAKISSNPSDDEERQDNNSDVEVLFRSTYDVEGNRGWFKSLEPKTKVIDEVINCWVEVLNFEEKYKAPGSNKRLFVGTKAIIEWMLNDVNTTEKQRMDKFSKNMKAAVYNNEELVDLKRFDLVLFPIVEFEHYYLIGFDLKNASIRVIDNWGDLYPLVRLHDNNEYFAKDSAFKVKHLFVNYLYQVKHPKCQEISAAPITKENIPWSTTNNLHDCGIFLMRHMEKYMGVGKPFDCGFSRHGQRKLAELRRLRTKYAARILLSDANVLKGEIVVKAQGK